MARPIPRFFVSSFPVTGALRLPEEESHHALHVKRLKPGDPLILFDGSGRSFQGVLTGTEGGHALVSLLREQEEASPPLLHVDVAVSPPKGKRMDFLVEKCAETGARTILPFSSARSVQSRIGIERIQRWRRITQEASKQARRNCITSVENLVPLDSILEKRSAYTHIFLFHPDPACPPMEAAMAEVSPNDSCLLVIGPEGGFSEQEIEKARSTGLTLLSSSFPILRVETAAIVTLACLLFQARRNALER